MRGIFPSVLIERLFGYYFSGGYFYFWSAVFMLHEIVGSSEQSLSLYIMSVWNASVFAFCFSTSLIMFCAFTEY